MTSCSHDARGIYPNRAEAYCSYFRTFYDLADERCRSYWGTSRPNGQAAGIESLVAFGGMALGLGPNAVVVDAGAGASSAILRTYFGDRVISCDPDGDYLIQVRLACLAMGLPEGRWVEGVPRGVWDACFYDYGTSVRGPTFPRFLDATRRLIWIDDAHDRDLVAVCRKACAERHLDLIEAPQALDEHGRFGAYVVKAW